jgi:hypothetical protein
MEFKMKRQWAYLHRDHREDEENYAKRTSGV